MSSHNMFSWRNKKYINTLGLKQSILSRAMNSTLLSIPSVLYRHTILFTDISNLFVGHLVSSQRKGKRVRRAQRHEREKWRIKEKLNDSAKSEEILICPFPPPDASTAGAYHYPTGSLPFT